MAETRCDRCGYKPEELIEVRIGTLVVLEACVRCADQIAGELISRLTPTGLARRWDTLGQLFHTSRLPKDESRVDATIALLSKPQAR
jgi:hypothetical protein